MPPKKKLKETEAKHVEKRNDGNYCESELSNSTNIPTRLSSLPSDILFHIYKFLTPTDLVSLSQLGDPRLKEVAEFQKELNFSVCWKGGVELLTSYFSRESVKHIQKLNFNAYVSARPCDLVQVISRCKNLVNLSIIECGIQYKQILKILKNCSTLKELAWSIKENIDDIEPDFHSSVTKLFLLFHMFSSKCGEIQVLRHFPKIERAVICCSPDALIVPPLNTSWSNVISFSSKNNLRRIFVLEMNSRTTPLFQITTWIKTFLSDLDTFEETQNHNSISVDPPPVTRVMSEDEYISALSSCSSNTYSNVLISLTCTIFDVYEGLFNCLSKVAGSRLKHLSIEFERYNSSDGDQSPLLYQTMSNLLGRLLLNCRNITVLNFGTVHFIHGSPFKAMCNLKNLKFLNMPTCAFPKDLPVSALLRNKAIWPPSSFQELVSSCCKVENFHLVCCYADKGKMRDCDIFPIKNWKRLISFTIYSVIFTSCQFLRKIADCCPKFRFFSYIASAENSGCIFYEDVIYLLTHAKNLSFIRINCANFNPQFERFLNSVSLAKTLEGICIVTHVDSYYDTSAFLESIKSLKYLHLFHFYAPRVSERLYTEVRKSMDRNNIKNGKVESHCIDHYTPTPQYFPETIRFHSKPFFTCSHMHLQQFLFDTCTYFDMM